MAYGIEISGSGGIFGISSNTSTTQHFGIKVPPTNIAAGTTITNWDRANGDLIFARPQSTTSGTNVTNNFLGLRLSSGNYSFHTAANYFIAQITTRAIANDSGGSSLVNGTDYGFIVYNTAGTAIMDSRRFNSGLEVLAVYDPGYFAGAGANGALSLTSSNLVYQASSTSTLQAVYMCVNTALRVIGQGAFNMYYYNFSDYAVYFYAYIQGSGGTPSYPSIGIKNSTAVVVGGYKA
tara:strand:- start:43 stop:750 length:708 start_codon:yes stop_codon:yes gene_type:complete